MQNRSGIADWVAIVAALFVASAALADHRIGVWNIEKLSPAEERGFPELIGANALPPRTPDQLRAVGRYICDDLDVDGLVVTEIEADIGTATAPRSSQMDVIVGEMGSDWSYLLGLSGGDMRIGFIWNTTRIGTKLITEMNAPEFKVEKYDVFDRDPLVLWVSLVENGQAMNDLIIVGLHLKSGQDYVHNHMGAMAKVFGDLREKDATILIPKAEKDVLILGDMNDSTHTRQEFKYIFDYADAAGFKHLGGDLAQYPATRVNGSEIDHLLASDQLVSAALVSGSFSVHNVPEADRATYRADRSDHFPVSVDIKEVADQD